MISPVIGVQIKHGCEDFGGHILKRVYQAVLERVERFYFLPRCGLAGKVWQILNRGGVYSLRSGHTHP